MENHTRECLSEGNETKCPVCIPINKRNSTNIVWCKRCNYTMSINGRYYEASDGKMYIADLTFKCPSCNNHTLEEIEFKYWNGRKK